MADSICTKSTPFSSQNPRVHVSARPQFLEGIAAFSRWTSRRTPDPSFPRLFLEGKEKPYVLTAECGSFDPLILKQA
jgi:hypothetical protein